MGVQVVRELRVWEVEGRALELSLRLAVRMLLVGQIEGEALELSM